MTSLSQIAKDIETHFQQLEGVAKDFLATHVPELVARAQALDSSPLLQAAAAIVEGIDPAAEPIVAKALSELASLFPPKPAAAPAAEPAAPAADQAPAQASDPAPAS